MNAPLKFRTSEQMVWFIGDLHYNHDRPFILNPRGYDHIDEAKADTIRSWNNTVGPNDVVINLGDQVFMDEEGQVAQSLIDMLHCKHHYYIWGNHNSGVKKLYRDALEKQYGIRGVEIYPLRYNDRFTFLGHYAEIYVDGKAVVLAHYPIDSWNGMSKLSWMIHGHCHMNLKQIDGYRMDVGWDRLKRPVSWNEVKQFMATRTFTPVDHHKTASQ